MKKAARTKNVDRPKSSQDAAMSSANARPASFISEWKYILLLAAVCLAVYSNTLTMNFVWDDLTQISANSQIKSLKNIPSFFTSHVWAGVSGAASYYYRPIFILSLAVDYFFWKLNPVGFHLTNILLHALASITFFSLALRLLQMRKAALFAALLFAVHPVHAEAVAWVAGRNEMLYTLFLFISFYFYVLYRDTFKSRHLVISLLLFLLSLLSKEMAVTFPLLLVLYETCFRKGRSWKALVTSGIFGLMFLIYFMVRSQFLKLPAVSHPLEWRLFTFPGLIIEYLRLLFFPFNLKVFYDIPIKQEFFTPGTIIPVLAFGIITYVIVLVRRYSVTLFFSLLFILITLLPVSGLLILIQPSLIAERYLYLPSAGLALAFGSFFLKLHTEKLHFDAAIFRHKSAALIATISLITIFGALNFYRNYAWTDEYTFMTQKVKDAPQYPEAHFGLGAAADSLEHFDEAVRAYQAALKLDPTYEKAHNNLGIVYDKLGSYEDAVTEYQSVLRINPDKYETHNNLGVVLEKMNRYDAAISEYQEALRINPRNLNSHKNLGLLFRRLNRPAEATKELQTAIQLNPDDAALHNSLGVVFLEQRRFDEALNTFQRAIRIEPRNAEFHNNLGLLYRKQQRLSEAIMEFQFATRLKPDYAAAYNNLGVVYAILGRNDEAISQFEIALSIDLNNSSFKKNLDRTVLQKGRELSVKRKG